MDWLFATATLIIGLGIGYFIGRPDAEERARARHNEEELKRVRDELAGYRMQVTQHFSKSAELIDGMTSSYRAFYDHLVSSSQQLCDEGDLRKLEGQVSRSRQELPSRAPVEGTTQEAETGRESGRRSAAPAAGLPPEEGWSEIMPESESAES